MKNIVPLEQLDTDILVSSDDLALPDWDAIKSSNASASWALIEDNNLQALCSVWLDNTPSFEKYDSCTLGHFFAIDSASGNTILSYAFNFLRNEGKDYVIGPMNGNTWQSYRFVSGDSGYPSFFMEPQSVSFWTSIFIDSGFEVIAEYSSSISEQPDYADRSIDKLQARIKQHGLVVRPFDLERSDEELKRVHQLSLTSFSRNYLYTDISQEEFMSLYRKIIPYVIPDFFQIVEDNGELVAYIFAIPDYSQKQRGEPVDTLIIKTVARSPERKYAGIGNYLVYHIHQLAIKHGYHKIIHALMHHSNHSRSISNKSAKSIRHYTLYGREL